MSTIELSTGQDHLEKVAKTSSVTTALAEYVWNALDADSTKVEIFTEENGLGGITAIVIKDNGHGISAEKAESGFGTLGESWKRRSSTTPNGRALHGKEGKGRLRFFSHSKYAEWESVSFNGEVLTKLEIKISGILLNKASILDVPVEKGTITGTTVKLIEPFSSSVVKDEDALRKSLAEIFAPYLLQHRNVVVSFNSIKVDPESIIEVDKDLGSFELEFEGKKLPICKIQVIEWADIRGDRRLHFGGSKGIVLGSQPGNIRAPGFSFSAYAYSELFDEMAEANLIEFDSLTEPRFEAMCGEVRDRISGYFRTRKGEEAESVIKELKAEGVYPYSVEPSNDIERVEREVFDAATMIIASYSPEFKGSDKKSKSLTLKFLQEAVRHNPDSISAILEAVLKLPRKKTDEFAKLLNRTQLSEIIASSTMIADRVETIATIKEMVFNPKFKNSIKERQELDVIVGDNTWIFDEHFAFSQQEIGLTRVMRRVEEELNKPKKKSKVIKPDGSSGRVDLFFGKSVPQPKHNEKEFIIVELKRPKVKVGRKELNQVEDYARALVSQSDYDDIPVKWTFYIISTLFKDEVMDRIYSKDRPKGQTLNPGNYEVWALSWSDVLGKAEARMEFIQRELRVQASDENIAARIASLQKTVLDKKDA